MDRFKTGLLNWDTTITGMAGLLFAKLSMVYPEFSEVFKWLSEGCAVLFVVLAKSASTGSKP